MICTPMQGSRKDESRTTIVMAVFPCAIIALLGQAAFQLCPETEL
jgi:hypothetical protein